MKRLFQFDETGRNDSLAEVTSDFIACTIKPQCTRKYMNLTPLQQRKVMIKCFKESVSRLRTSGLPVIASELHFERFNNGNLHAHGAVHIIGDLSETIWADQLQKDFLQRYPRLGKLSMLCKLPFGDKEKWYQYMNKSNVLEPLLTISPIGEALNIEYIIKKDCDCKIIPIDELKPSGCMSSLNQLGQASAL